MLFFLSIFCLRIYFTNQICINQVLEEELDLKEDNIDIWITYQNDNQYVKDLSNNVVQISTNNKTYYIKAQLTHDQFKFYSDELKEFKTQNITAFQGQYFSINIKFPEFKKKLNIKYNIFFDDHILLRICSSNYYVNGPVINSYNQDLFRQFESVLELDNNKLFFQIWMKEIVASHLNSQTIYILQYLDFIQNSDNEIQFTHEFQFKGKKLFFYNQNKKQVLSQDIQQLMQFNYWYLLIFKQLRKENQEYDEELFIYSIYSEYYKFKTNQRYSFRSGIQLLMKNTIFSQFTVIQDSSNDLYNFTSFCQPDCLRCDQLVCQECKNNLFLQNGQCTCDLDMFSTDEGICKYPPQILILQEKVQIYESNICRFGYYFDKELDTCRECSFFSGQQYYQCISTQSFNSNLNLFFSSQSVCDFGFFLKSGQCRKCPVNCEVCELSKNQQMTCLFCDNSLIINNLCQQCNIQNCELCVSLNNTQQCKICKDLYSKNELNQCIYTDIDQFEQLKIQLQIDFQLTKNFYDKNCELFFPEAHQCVLCAVGFQNIQQQCLQCENEFISEIFDKNNILAQKQYINIVDQNFKLKFQQSKMANNQKCYNDTSQHIVIQKEKQLEFNDQKYYFNQIFLDQISFCRIENDCFNLIDFDAELVLIKGQFYILHQKKFFANTSKLVYGIQNYSIYIQEYNLNIKNKGNLNMTVNQFKYCFELRKNINIPLNLNLNLNITMTNNIQDNILKLQGYKTIKLNGIKFALNKSFIFNIESSQLIIINFLIHSSLTFIITRSYLVVFNDSKISNVLAKQNLFYFDCNLYFISSNITFINSTFIRSVVFGFYKSLQKGWVIDYSFRNIFFNESKLFQARNSSQIWCHFQNFNFINIKMNNSSQFQFTGIGENDQIFTRAANFTYKKILLKRSNLFMITSATVQNITFNNLELTESSNLFTQNYMNQDFKFQLINITLYYTIIHTQSRILALINQGAVLIKHFQIIEIQVILSFFELEFITILSTEIEIKQYLIINKESEINLRKHMYLEGDFIIINDYQIRGQQDNLIQINSDLLVKPDKQLLLKNLIYDNVIITDYQLIFIKILDRIKIIITNSYFNVVMTFQNYNQVFTEIKSSVIRVENNRQCQFYLLESQFKVSYVEQYSQKLRQKLIIYLKGSENLQWSYDIIIKDCNFNIINNDKNMAQYFSFSGNIIKIYQVGIQIQEKFKLDFEYSKNYSSIFMIFGNQITINRITVYQIALHSTLFNIKDFALEKYSNIQFANIDILQGSTIRRFLNLETNNSIRASLLNISIQCYIIETLLYMYLSQENTFILMLNFTIDVIYYSKNDFLIQLYGSRDSKVKLVNFKIIGSHRSKSIGYGLVLDANLGFITLENFFVADFLMSAAQILADYIYIDKFKIINCQSDNNMITISEQVYYQIITILNIVLTKNIVYSNSLVHIDLNCTQIAIFSDWRILKNKIKKSLIYMILQNQSHYPKAYLRLVKLEITDNTCDNCILLESQQLQTLKIIETILINNFGNYLIQLNGFLTNISGSKIINTVNDYKTTLIRSNNQLKINNTIIFSIKSITFQIPASYTEMSILNKFFVIKEQGDEQRGLVSYKNLDPDNLKLTFTNENSLHNLEQEEIKNKTVFLMNSGLLKDKLMYFPSGQSLKEYRVLIIKAKQYSQLLQNFQLFGFNINNNLIISINTCQINLLDNEQQQSNMIKAIPQFLYENQTFMDLILVGNPYNNDVFTFEAVCNFSNTTLVFQQNIKLLKCQLGEYFNLDNQCKKCNIDKGFYSVLKRSSKCKPVNYEIIDQLNHGLIKIKNGFWRPHYSNDQIEFCYLNPQNCLGGWDVGFDSCQIGYLGALCQECDLQNIRGDGHYGKLYQHCYLCRFSYGIIFKVFFFVLFQLLTIIISSRSQYLICQRYQNLIVSNKFYRILNKLSIDQPSVLIKQIQNYFFYIQFISYSIQIDLYVEFLVKILSNPISLANPHYDCMVKNFETPELITKIFIQLLTPILVLIIFYILLIIINRYLNLKFIFTFIFLPLELVFIIYSMGIFQFVIGIITRVKISGIWWIQTYKSIEYYDKSNIPLFMLITIIILILIILIPLIMLKILHSRRNQLQEKNWLIKFGYLYQEYQVNIYYWEFIKMGLKLLFTTQTMLFQNDSDIKYIITVLLIVIQSEIIKQFQPYYLKNLNKFDRNFHLLLLITTLNFILVHQSDSYQQMILTLILYTVNAIYFLMILKFMIKKYIFVNPILFDKLKLMVSKNSSENDSYQMKKSQTKQRFLMMKRYAKSQISYKINQQQYSQMQMMIKSNIFSNLSEAVNQELELISIPQSDYQTRNNKNTIICQSQPKTQTNEIELQSIQANIRQITIEDLPQSNENDLPERIE